MDPRLLSIVAGGLAILSLSRTLCAEPSARVEPPRAEFTLKNGLRTILVPVDASSSIALVVSYAVGSAHDPPTYRGLAHLAEHLTFRGSTHLRPLEGLTILEELGAGYQGFTELERTVYLTVAPAFALETILWIESERMGFTLGRLDETTLSLEQRVVSNELRERERFFEHHWRNALYGEAHPFSAPENEVSDVQAVELGGVRWFFQRAYRPDNATLAIVGNLDPERARASVEKYLGPIVNPRVPRASVSALPPRLCGIHELDVAHQYMLGEAQRYTWALPKGASPRERSALELARRVLAERLTQVLVKERFRASAVETAIEYHATHGLFSVDVDVDVIGEDSWQAVKDTTLAEARRVAEQPVSALELSQARKSALLEHELRNDDALEYALSLVHGEDFEAEGAALSTLDAAAVRLAARPLAGGVLVLTSMPGGPNTKRPRVKREINPCE